MHSILDNFKWNWYDFPKLTKDLTSQIFVNFKFKPGQNKSGLLVDVLVKSFKFYLSFYLIKVKFNA